MANQRTEKQELRCVLVTDCGSTTTKALLFEKTDKGWRQTFRGEAPTTVENPVADVTVGALNAFEEIQELSGRKLLQDSPNGVPFEVSEHAGDAEGIDLYLSTSSAGGGLQMIVSGIVQDISTQSAARAALGAGAIVLDEIAADDSREEYELIERIRHIKPDIVLIAG
ncbi:MAG: glutamate mutase L, partial [Bdellovibrionales bacterium]|nr:glutamate mutase L [Bdellovibrionales bacterium]